MCQYCYRTHCALQFNYKLTQKLLNYNFNNLQTFSTNLKVKFVEKKFVVQALGTFEPNMQKRTMQLQDKERKSTAAL